MSRGVVRGEANFVEVYLAGGVDFENTVFGRLDFGLADPGGAVDDLTLKV